MKLVEQRQKIGIAKVINQPVSGFSFPPSLGEGGIKGDG